MNYPTPTLPSPPALRLRRLATALATLTLACAHAAFATGALATKPDALLQIDLNRTSVVDKIVDSWKGELPAAQIDSFRSKLSALRADQLLAANVSGSFDGVLEVVNRQELTLLARHDVSDQSKALGDATQDLVYAPITPCRIADTRSASAAGIPNPMLGNVAYGIKSFSSAGFASYGGSATNCNLPSTGEVRAIVANVIGLQQAGLPNFTAFVSVGDSNVLATLLSNAALNFNANQGANATVVIPTNATGDLYMAMPTGLRANFVVDVTGYFKAPGGIIGDITDIQTAAGSGLTGGSASGVANLALANGYKLPQACANGQVPKYNTATLVWDCANDLQGTGAGGSGTVTNIATGAGLSGGPITTTGTINLASTQLLPTTACTTNQIPKWNGTSWACAADTSPTNAWTQGGNAFSAPGVIGATNTMPLTVQGGDSVKVILRDTTDGLRIFRGFPETFFPSSPVVFNGSASNGLPPNFNFSTEIFSVTVAGGGGAGECGSPPVSCANIVSAAGTTISGGRANRASGLFATVSGGQLNSASGNRSTVSGGEFNSAAGDYSVVPGGSNNEAGGTTSFAAGNRATVRTTDHGTFMWSDFSSGQDFISTGINQFLIRANGGFGLNTNDPGGTMHVRRGTGAGTIVPQAPTLLLESSSSTLVHMFSPDTVGNASGIRFGSPSNNAHSAILAFNDDQSLRFRSGGTTATRMLIQADGFVGIARTGATHPLHIGTSATTGNGAHLTVGGAWTNGSSRAFKDQFAALDAKEILRKVVSLPVLRWNYKGTEERHIGPIAEDFHKTFNVGSDPQYISTVDASGVALAAIQGLAAVVKEKDAKISALEKKASELDALKLELAAIKRKLGL
jgi:trimeric autotransporter adhesin